MGVEANSNKTDYVHPLVEQKPDTPILLENNVLTLL